MSGKEQLGSGFGDLCWDSMSELAKYLGKKASLEEMPEIIMLKH